MNYTGPSIWIYSILSRSSLLPTIDTINTSNSVAISLQNAINNWNYYLMLEPYINPFLKDYPLTISSNEMPTPLWSTILQSRSLYTLQLKADIIFSDNNGNKNTTVNVNNTNININNTNNTKDIPETINILDTFETRQPFDLITPYGNFSYVYQTYHGLLIVSNNRPTTYCLSKFIQNFSQGIDTTIVQSIAKNKRAKCNFYIIAPYFTDIDVRSYYNMNIDKPSSMLVTIDSTLNSIVHQCLNNTEKINRMNINNTIINDNTINSIPTNITFSYCNLRLASPTIKEKDKQNKNSNFNKETLGFSVTIYTTGQIQFSYWDLGGTLYLNSNKPLFINPQMYSLNTYQGLFSGGFISNYNLSNFQRPWYIGITYFSSPENIYTWYDNNNNIKKLFQQDVTYTCTMGGIYSLDNRIDMQNIIDNNLRLWIPLPINKDKIINLPDTIQLGCKDIDQNIKCSMYNQMDPYSIIKYLQTITNTIDTSTNTITINIGRLIQFFIPRILMIDTIKSTTNTIKIYGENLALRSCIQIYKNFNSTSNGYDLNIEQTGVIDAIIYTNQSISVYYDINLEIYKFDIDILKIKNILRSYKIDSSILLVKLQQSNKLIDHQAIFLKMINILSNYTTNIIYSTDTIDEEICKDDSISSIVNYTIRPYNLLNSTRQYINEKLRRFKGCISTCFPNEYALSEDSHTLDDCNVCVTKDTYNSNKDCANTCHGIFTTNLSSIQDVVAQELSKRVVINNINTNDNNKKVTNATNRNLSNIYNNQMDYTVKINIPLESFIIDNTTCYCRFDRNYISKDTNCMQKKLDNIRKYGSVLQSDQLTNVYLTTDDAKNKNLILEPINTFKIFFINNIYTIKNSYKLLNSINILTFKILILYLCILLQIQSILLLKLGFYIHKLRIWCGKYFMVSIFPSIPLNVFIKQPTSRKEKDTLLQFITDNNDSTVSEILFDVAILNTPKYIIPDGDNSIRDTYAITTPYRSYILRFLHFCIYTIAKHLYTIFKDPDILYYNDLFDGNIKDINSLNGRSFRFKDSDTENIDMIQNTIKKFTRQKDSNITTTTNNNDDNNN